MNSNNILLKEEGRLISDEKERANLMSYFFIDITAELDLKKDTETFLSTTITLNEVLEKFQYHPSIKRMRDNFSNDEKLFPFTGITKDQVIKEISCSDGSKLTPIGDIP